MEVTNQVKEEIYSNYYNKIVRYLNSQMNDYDLAQDMASDIFVKIFEKLDSFDDSKASISTWIYTFSRNHMLDYFKTRKVESEFDESYMIDEQDDDESIYSEDNIETLASALKSLKDKERTLIVEHYYNNVSLKDIARKLNISYIYAKVMHANCLRKLGKFFKK